MKKQLTYLGTILLITAVFGVFYIAVQQAMRRGANEPQASMANDVASALENGARPQDLAKGQVNMANNMAPFVIIYDKNGNVAAGNGYLDGQVPQVPIGVLRAATRDNANEVTWQPVSKVRIASVSYATRDYYVLGGRSLKVVDKQIGRFTRWLALVWAIIVAVIVGVYMLQARRNRAAAKVANAK